MNELEIKEKVNQTLADEFELSLDELTPEARFKEELGLDSLDAVDMVIALERQFGIKIGKDPEIVQIKTVGELYGFLAKKLSA